MAIFFVVSIGYSFVLQRDKVVVTMLAIYAGIVIANILNQPLLSFFSGDKTVANQLFVKANASPFSIQTALFLIVTILISVRSGLSGRSSSGRSGLSIFELGLFSFLNTTLILAAIFSFLSSGVQAQFVETSKVAALIINHSSWWFVAPIVALIAIGIKNNRD